MLESVRSAVKRLQASPEMTDAVRAAFRITIPSDGRTPPPVPTTRPLPAVNSGERLRHTLKIADESDPTRRARRPLDPDGHGHHRGLSSPIKGLGGSSQESARFNGGHSSGGVGCEPFLRAEMATARCSAFGIARLKWTI